MENTKENLDNVWSMFSSNHFKNQRVGCKAQGYQEIENSFLNRHFFDDTSQLWRPFAEPPRHKSASVIHIKHPRYSRRVVEF